MAQTTTAAQPAFGQTERRDAWWAGPLVTFLVLAGFIVYASYAGMTSRNFEIRINRGYDAFHEKGNVAVAPYLSPFYSPLIYDAQSPHAWIQQSQPSWWPQIAQTSWWPQGIPWPLAFSSAVLILAGPALFRLTCYYYRKAYYRSFWADPPACAVGEPRKTYWGENSLPLILQNAHRFALYVALLFLVILWYDAIHAFIWPVLTPDSTNTNFTVTGHKFGMGMGTIVMLINVLFLTGYTCGCHSLRHLVGGRLDCFSCVANGQRKVTPRYGAWKFVTKLNENHQLFAWLSLFSVGFTDFYIRMCSLGVINDIRFF
ncbi:MAG TPA: succinate dehydrogenase [Planctomycetota bacterium]|nr:succinate dehydrogenase [Planctomycetota bacterium]